MKNPHLIPLAAIVLLATSGCDRRSVDVEKKLAELEQKNNEAADRQRELEQELEDRKLAAERDAIERERARIEEDRAEMERELGEAAAAEDEALRQRELVLANREGQLEQFQEALAEKEDELEDRDQELSEKDRELAGREAVDFQETQLINQTEPDGDYGMFYDSLDSYGSWFETPDYGYVWQPVAVRDSNWRPYSRGRWACSDRGWMWISEEPFGWATYHYGRWALLRGRGWIWVPGIEWAPCWVSWRENDNHIGWAPLPPETMAYLGHHWDSTVDVQFGIGAACFSFVETRHFGSQVYRHCLPVSRNLDCYRDTTNITFIHIKDRQVICGGPRYKRVSDRIGKQLPFYRLEVDRHPRPGKDPLGMRPRVKGGRLLVSAPNMDAEWNHGLKPARIKGRLENVAVERNGELSGDIRNRYRLSREEGRQKAEEAVGKPGGPEKLNQARREKLQENPRQVEAGRATEQSRDTTRKPQREIPGSRLPERPADRQPRVEALPDGVTRQPVGNRDRQEDRRETRVTPVEEVKPRQQQPARPQRQVEAPEVETNEDSTRRENAGRVQQEETTRREQRQAEQARETRQEAIKQRQEEQARQEQVKQREAEQAREARRQAMEQERAQQEQQEEARQRQEERARRQEEAAEQQREEQRQQERAQRRQQEEENQRQQERAQQRQQEENQRQQENARQRQQEENQRQRQADESRQKQEKDQEEQRKRNR